MMEENFVVNCPFHLHELLQSYSEIFHNTYNLRSQGNLFHVTVGAYSAQALGKTRSSTVKDY